MPDTPFKAMGREKRYLSWFDLWGRGDRRSVACEKCGGRVYEGDWPFCKGNPRDHER